MSTIVFGNGGDIHVAPTGEVTKYDWSEEVATGDHAGYGDVIHVDLAEWRAFYGYGLTPMSAAIDILDVDCHLVDGRIIHAEPEHREMCRETINLNTLGA